MGLSIYNCGSLLSFCGFSVCYLEWGGVPQVMAWYQVSWPVLAITCAEVEQCDRFFEKDVDDILYMFSLRLKHGLKKHRNHWFFLFGDFILGIFSIGGRDDFYTIYWSACAFNSHMGHPTRQFNSVFWQFTQDVSMDAVMCMMIDRTHTV